ncbi:MAG: hypothetical protein WBE43_07985, partial [Candidatus Acidiferrales bacterium]
FEAVLNEVGPAASTIIQIIALVKGDPANVTPVTKIDADVAALEKLYTDFAAATAANKGSIAAEINGDFGTLNSDLSSVFAIAQVSDKNTQAKITALIGLIQSAVQIAEAAIPSPNPAAVAPAKLNASSLVDSFNKILVAKTGNAVIDRATPCMKLHLHGKFVRAISFGRAQ